MRTTDETVSTLDTVLTLPWQTSVMALASACRETALSFVNDSRHWGKAELAMWLIGPYAQLLQYTTVLTDRTSMPDNVDRIGEIDARLVERILENARGEVISVLDRIASDEDGVSFAFSIIAAENVVHCVDANGGVGWAPSGRPTRLADRVLALFAADYLTRPGAAEELVVCNVCQRVDFDRTVRKHGICLRHRSAIIFPNGRTNTLPYFPDGA
jgi:hypothetical protein